MEEAMQCPQCGEYGPYWVSATGSVACAKCYHVIGAMAIDPAPPAREEKVAIVPLDELREEQRDEGLPETTDLAYMLATGIAAGAQQKIVVTGQLDGGAAVVFVEEGGLRCDLEISPDGMIQGVCVDECLNVYGLKPGGTLRSVTPASAPEEDKP